MVEFQGADDFFTTMAEGGGKAYRFTDIDGIGPATADKITSIRAVQNPEDVADMSADELSDKAGISHSRATKAIKGGGGNPNVSKQDNTGTVSAAGISKRQGDFWVEYTEMDKARARNDTQSRSEEAVRTDDRKRAPVTTDYEKWKKNPGKWDFPGVDTPKNEPNLLPKDVKRGDPNTADFDESGEAEFDEQEEDTFPRVVDSPSGIEILETGDDRVPATDVTRSVPNPDTFAPGVAPEDFEQDEPEPGPDVMGPEPSATRLPETARQNLASGESADISFVQAEQSRSEQESQSFGEELMNIREERGNIIANAKYWEQKVREFEQEDMTVEFDEVTSIAGQTVVELGDFFEGDESSVDAVVTGLAERGAPVKGVEGTERVRIDVSDEPRPVPFRERERSITGRFVREE